MVTRPLGERSTAPPDAAKRTPPVPCRITHKRRAPCPAAEGRDDDLAAARFLLAHPGAYAAALMPVNAGAPLGVARAP